MRSVPLSSNLADDHFRDGERDHEAAIHAEIASRVLELRELCGPDRTVRFFQKMLVIFGCEPAGPAAFWVLQRLLSGDLTEITRSYTEQGKQDNRTKQATQQELERVLNLLAHHYPKLKEQIIKIRHVSANLESDHANCKNTGTTT